jgi:hypothetical protein
VLASVCPLSSLALRDTGGGRRYVSHYVRLPRIYSPGPDNGPGEAGFPSSFEGGRGSAPGDNCQGVAGAGKGDGEGARRGRGRLKR